MADAKRDNNSVTTLLAVSNADGITPVVLWADPVTHRLLTSPANAQLVVGTSVVSGGSTTNILYDNAGVLGEYTITGTGTVVVMQGSPTITTPVINGTITGTGQATAATASTIAMRDANGNSNFVNVIDGFTTTVTSASPVTLTVSSNAIQVFTGSTAQTLTLPTTGVAAGQQYLVINQSSAAVTVQSSGANTIVILAAGTSATLTAVVATPTTAANWNAQYFGDVVTTAKKLSVSNTLTLAGTDGTTMTFPTTTATIARTDAGQTFTGTQVFGAITVTTINSLTVTASAGTLTIPNNASAVLQMSGNFNLTLTVTGATTPTFPSGTHTLAGLDVAQTWAAVQTFTNSDIALLGSSTGKTTFTSANAGSSNFTLTFPAVTDTLAVLGTNQTFTAQQKFNNFIPVNNPITASGNAATVPVTFELNTVTNNSAATLTITMTTASAVDGQETTVRILDATAVAQTITWVNTENSSVSAPTTSNGSTTLFRTVKFIYNAGTSKWRCILNA